MAEGGFEPPVQLLTVRRFSNQWTAIPGGDRLFGPVPVTFRATCAECTLRLCQPTQIAYSRIDMADAEREDLVAYLGANPEAGKIVAETGGVRKVR